MVQSADRYARTASPSMFRRFAPASSLRWPMPMRLIVSGQARARARDRGRDVFAPDGLERTGAPACLFGDGAGALLLEAQDWASAHDLRSWRPVERSSTPTDGIATSSIVDGGVSTHTHRASADAGQGGLPPCGRKARGDGPYCARKGRTGRCADVDWIVPHQANLRIIKATAQRMGVPMERVVVTVQDHGNTSAASIPLGSFGRQIPRPAQAGRSCSSWRPSAAGWPGDRWYLRW